MSAHHAPFETESNLSIMISSCMGLVTLFNAFRGKLSGKPSEPFHRTLHFASCFALLAFAGTPLTERPWDRREITLNIGSARGMFATCINSSPLLEVGRGPY